jgi:hypothetical protein
MMCKPKVNIGRTEAGTDASNDQGNSLLTAYTWLAMFIGQIGIYVRKAGAFRLGIFFRWAAHLKTRIHERESDEDRYLLPYLSAELP